MDAELASLAGTAATTVVAALATDAWENTRRAIGRLWSRIHPERADTIDAELVEARTDLLKARADGNTETEADIVASWRLRLRQVLAADPSAAAELRQILDELQPAAATGGQAWTGGVSMNATASGQARIYQVGQGNQHITEG